MNFEIPSQNPTGHLLVLRSSFVNVKFEVWAKQTSGTTPGNRIGEGGTSEELIGANLEVMPSFDTRMRFSAREEHVGNLLSMCSSGRVLTIAENSAQI